MCHRGSRIVSPVATPSWPTVAAHTSAQEILRVGLGALPREVREELDGQDIPYRKAQNGRDQAAGGYHGEDDDMVHYN